MVPNYGHDEDGRGCSFFTEFDPSAAGMKRARKDAEEEGESGGEEARESKPEAGVDRSVWLQATSPSSEFIVLDRRWPQPPAPAVTEHATKHPAGIPPTQTADDRRSHCDRAGNTPAPTAAAASI